MTHDELLKRLLNDSLMGTPLSYSLLKTIELHTPETKTLKSVFGNTFTGDETPSVTQEYCSGCHYRYPCNTIRAIEKELT